MYWELTHRSENGNLTNFGGKVGWEANAIDKNVGQKE